VEEDEEGNEDKVDFVEAEEVDEESEEKEESDEKEEEDPSKDDDEAEGEQKEDETEEEEPKKKPKNEPPAQKAKKSGPSMIGLIIIFLGAVGIVGAFLLDPILNMTDSSHPAAIAIGTIQMMGIALAAVVLIIGIVITVMPRKKASSG
jgi:uncharacterized membrane protein YdbT with pleckstrin-like domain